ncbi:MAG TPA: tetratricopeptide repeat protein [Stellaceae bacterium]|nr:tetratricopeptide repeat protein [Stellaceae bacterium]
MTGATESAPAAERAAFCRRAEQLLRDGRTGEALALAHAAFDVQSDDEETVRLCAWLFSNGHDHAAAGAAYERLLALCPQWIAGHRHASGSFAVAGALERAIFHGMRASDRDPASFEFALHAGCLCEQAGRREEAAFYLSRAAALAPEDGIALRRLSAVLWQAGERDAAVAAAVRAWRCDPADRDNADHAAELLLRSERFDEAVLILNEAIRRHPDDDAALRKLSAAEMLRGHIEAALAAVEAALAHAPQTAEYHLHRAGLLHRLGNPAAAAEAYGRAAVLDPPNRAARRAQLAAYCDAGRIAEALALGGALICEAPDSEDYAEALLHVLARRRPAQEDRVLAGARALRPPRPPRGAAASLATQLRVLHALILRETRTRFGESRLGYGWALLEPILHMLMLALVFAVMMRGRPPIGRHFFIFYYTGLVPYHLFAHTSSTMTFAIASNGSLLQLPLVGSFDVVLARGLLELATDLVVASILLAGFAAIGLDAVPRDLPGACAALFAVWLFACGVGFLNAVIHAFWKGWDKIWVQIIRILYFCSGIFYVPAAMPDRVRHLLVWNPVLQAVDWFRTSFFADYEPHWLDRGYLVTLALWTLLTGMALERLLRRRLLPPP